MSNDIKKLLDNAKEVVEGARRAAVVPDDGFWVELDEHFNGKGPDEPQIEPRRTVESS